MPRPVINQTIEKKALISNSYITRVTNVKKMSTQSSAQSKSMLTQYLAMLSQELTASARGPAPKRYVKPKTNSANPKTKDADICLK